MNRKVIGYHACLEALKVRPKKIAVANFKNDWAKVPELKDLRDQCVSAKIRIKEIHPQELDKIGFGHQGVCFELTESPQFKDVADCSLLLGLDGVEDPQNFGAIIRTAWLMAVDGIYIPAARAVGLTPSVAKVASGGVEHVPVEQTNQILQAIEFAKKNEFWVYGLSEKGKSSLWDIQFPKKVFLVAGGEENGMKTQTLKGCDELISIPQTVADASYNVSVSVGIGLAEIRRQWRSGS